MTGMATALMRREVAMGKMNKRDARLAMRQQYDNARNVYVTGAQQTVDLLEGLGNRKVDLDHMQANMQGLEAGAVADGLYADCGNDAQRKAALAQWRVENQAYVLLYDMSQTAKREIANAEARIEHLKFDLRLARLDMQMSISEVMELAGEDWSVNDQ